jgi:hypothetical protein
MLTEGSGEGNCVSKSLSVGETSDSSTKANHVMYPSLAYAVHIHCKNIFLQYAEHMLRIHNLYD